MKKNSKFLTPFAYPETKRMKKSSNLLDNYNQPFKTCFFLRNTTHTLWIDFSKIDLSEVVDDIRLDKSAYEKKLKGSVDSLKTKIQAEITTKRLKWADQPNQTGVNNEKIEEKNDQN